MAREQFLTLQVTDQLLTAVEFGVDRDNEVLALNYASVELDLGVVEQGVISNPQALETALIKLKSNAKPKAFTSDKVLLIVDNAVVFDNYFTFAGDTNSENLRMQLDLKLTDKLPFKLSEIAEDHIESKDSDQIFLQSSAIPTTIQKSYISMINKIGLKVMGLTTAKEAYKSVANSKRTGVIDLFIELGESHTKLIVIKSGLIADEITLNCSLDGFVENLSKESNVGRDHVWSLIHKNLLGPEVIQTSSYTDFLEQTVTELSNAIMTVCNSAEIGNIGVWGLGIRIPNFITAINTGLKIKSKLVVLWKPIALPKQIKTNAELVRMINLNIANFGLIVGVSKVFLAKKKDAEMVNLVPSELKVEASTLFNSYWYKYVAWMQIGMSVALIFFIAYAYVSSQLELLKFEKQTQNFNSLIYGERYDRVRSDIVAFNDSVNQLFNLANNLEELPNEYKAILRRSEPGIRLESVKYDRVSKIIDLRGFADSRKRLLDFQDVLSRVIGEGKLDSPLSNFNSSEDVPFEIKLQLKPNN